MEKAPRPLISIEEQISNNPGLSALNSIAWEPKWEANLIIENLYHGSIDSAFDYEGLVANGITHIVHLETYFQPKFVGEFEYLVCHLDDIGGKDLIPVIEQALPFIREGRKSGNVLVHCAAGISRSSSVVLAYLLSDELARAEFQWKDVKECRAWLKTKRTIADPQVGFIRCLNELERNQFDLQSAAVKEFLGRTEAPKIERKRKGEK